MNIAGIIEYLRCQQQADGSFAGYASPASNFKKPWREQPTVFPTILILDCLTEVAGAEDICERAASYVQSQISAQGSWNYWPQKHSAREQEPYPDDLDDTSCAVAALTRYDAGWATSERLGRLAHLLVAVEKQVGGPYNTWLIDTRTAPQWQQVDLAVNANIAYALSLQKVLPGGLQTYLESAITAKQLLSAYYVGEFPLLYFMSRIQHELLQGLKPIVEAHLQKLPASALSCALLLSAACRLRIDREQLDPLAELLKSLVTTNHWSAEAFYIDPVYNGKQHYGGSEALTTAFALEALALYGQSATPERTGRQKRPALSAVVRQDIARLPDAQLRREYAAIARKMAGNQQVSEAAQLMAEAGFNRVSAKNVQHLNAASLHGWVGYTLQDNVLDGDHRLQQLPVANAALRRSYDHFMQAADQQVDFKEYVAAVFDCMDAANKWELEQARAEVQNDTLHLLHLPQYDGYEQLAERSLGHSLAACGVASLHYGSFDHPKVALLRTFFKHFLIARQLNDDAHDWEADLQVGHLSSVVTLLLRDQHWRFNKDYAIPQQLEALRQRFWRQTIDTVTELINHHITLARAALIEFDSHITTTTFEKWLFGLESSAEKAQRSRDDALQFIQAYEESNV